MSKRYQGGILGVGFNPLQAPNAPSSLTAPTGYIAGCSNATRGLFGGGLSNGGVYLNTIEYITIVSASSSVDFGDLTVGRSTLAACSNAHGGL